MDISTILHDGGKQGGGELKIAKKGDALLINMVVISDWLHDSHMNGNRKSRLYSILAQSSCGRAVSLKN